jgi:hypothetical protein
MRRLFTSSSDTARFVRHVAVFAVGFIPVCVLTLWLVGSLPAPDLTSADSPYSLYQFMTRNFTLPGGYGYTLTRFREAEETRDVDVLFLGSSRCYYSFAPHVFDRVGLKSFNLGSPSQTPLNTRILLDRYWEQLDPKIVVFEVNLHIMEKDGVESFYDLMINTPPSWAMARMSLATRLPHALTGLAVHALSTLSRPFDSVRMQSRPMDPYLGKGAVAAKNFNQETFKEKSSEVHIPDRQLGYLADIIDFVHSHDAQIVLAVAPIPREWRAIITNYPDVMSELGDLANRHGARLYDFNAAMTLDTRTDFKDFHHLNANGSKVFSYDILDSLLDVPNYRQALDIDPALAAEVYNGRGIAFAEKGDFIRAIDDYHRALELNPGDAMIHYNLARVCEKAGRVRGAIDAYRRFVDLAPPEYHAYVAPVKAQIKTLEAGQSSEFSFKPAS